MQQSDSSYYLGINLGYAVNRYPEPEEWVETINQIGVKRVQFVADLLNPSLPRSFREKKIELIQDLCSHSNILIQSAFTGAFTRVNHFGSEDEELREYWLGWFYDYAEQMIQLGIKSIGGHPGILSLKSDANSDNRKRRLLNIAIYWQRLLERVAPLGIKTILWE